MARYLKRGMDASAVRAADTKVRDDLVDMHYVRIFVMHVEQVDLVCELGAVERAFLDE